jgi:uncharacterized membrane protein (DUF485 family)
MGHGQAVKLGVDHAQKKKTKLGITLFAIYSIVYIIFVAIGVLDYKILGKIVLGNQNLAVVYGFGLILLAVIMGLIYNFICTKYENELNKEED